MKKFRDEKMLEMGNDLKKYKLKIIPNLIWNIKGNIKDSSDNLLKIMLNTHRKIFSESS